MCADAADRKKECADILLGFLPIQLRFATKLLTDKDVTI
jgi:hypothetical protein